MKKHSVNSNQVFNQRYQTERSSTKPSDVGVDFCQEKKNIWFSIFHLIFGFFRRIATRARSGRTSPCRRRRAASARRRRRRPPPPPSTARKTTPRLPTPPTPPPTTPPTTPPPPPPLQTSTLGECPFRTFLPSIYRVFFFNSIISGLFFFFPFLEKTDDWFLFFLFFTASKLIYFSFFTQEVITFMCHCLFFFQQFSNLNNSRLKLVLPPGLTRFD